NQILPRSPLPVDAACALIGEVGSALVTSARRGLFHMFLRPSVVGLTSKGAVVIAGIGIDAALALDTGLVDPKEYTPTRSEARRGGEVGGAGWWRDGGEERRVG